MRMKKIKVHIFILCNIGISKRGNNDYEIRLREVILFTNALMFLQKKH
jgi:hypothetical protein